MLQDFNSQASLSLADWGLSHTAVTLLSKRPEILADLERDRQLPPFPLDYVPEIIEVLFDDLPYFRSEQGVLIYMRDCSPNYEPQFIEYRFDDETAVFQVGDEYVINRITQDMPLPGQLIQGGSDGNHNQSN
jgi:hypothetical protein